MLKKLSIMLLFSVAIILTGCKKDDDGNPATTDPCAATLETAVSCKHALPVCDGEDQLYTSVRCLGTNKNGERCSNKTKDPCGYCATHKDQWTGTCPNKTKNACGYCDDHKGLHSEE